MKLSVLASLAFLAAVPAVATAQWSDNFDSYVPGTINGQGGWQGWGGSAGAAGTVVTAPAQSSPHSQQITVGSDSVRKFSGFTSGAYTLYSSVYIPSNMTGDSYFILLNRYADPSGPFNWSVELLFDASANVVFDDLANVGLPSPGSNSVPIVRDQWVPIRVDFDLTADTFSSYYNNSLVMSGAWKRGSATAMAEFAAIDLFDPNATNQGSVYYDDFVLVPAPASLALLGMGGLIVGRRRRN